MAADSEHPVPTERARELVRGGVDYHVHIAPDFVSRRITDVQLARRCLQTGQAGFGLKSHYSSTAERAQVVAEAVPGVTVLGAITLNRSVGGLNPLAVEIAAREGARIVWFPTVSSVNEQHEVLEVVARHQMVLCTGHLSRDEIFALVDAAVGAGIETIVVTHPEFPSQSVAPDDQIELARKGALLERCFTTTHTGKAPWERFYEATRAVGPEHTVWSSDLGQNFNPPVEDGLALMADRFLAAGFSEDDVRTMAVANTRRVAGLAGAPATIGA